MERQDQMREQNVNLHLHLQHLSEGDDFLNEWNQDQLHQGSITFAHVVRWD